VKISRISGRVPQKARKGDLNFKKGPKKKENPEQKLVKPRKGNPNPRR